MTEKNGYVRWPGFIGTLLTASALILGICGAVGGFALAQHAEHPHDGAITRDEFNLVLRALDRIEGKVDELIK